MTSTSLPEQFNLQVEADLLFYKKYVVLHLVCRCTRWHAAIQVSNKETATLIDGINRAWVSIHGPMKELIVDGEKGIQSVAGAEWLSRHGIKLVHNMLHV